MPLYVPCGHLLGKGWPLGSRLRCLTVSLLLSHWYPVSGVVLDCIDSRSLHPYLLKWIFRVLQPFVASWTTQNLIATAKLTCPCTALRTSNSFSRCDTGVVIDREQHLSCTCKSSFLFAPLAVRVHIGCSAFPFWTPTKPLMRLNIKFKIVLSPKLLIISICSYFPNFL